MTYECLVVSFVHSPPPFFADNPRIHMPRVIRAACRRKYISKSPRRSRSPAAWALVHRRTSRQAAASLRICLICCRPIHLSDVRGWFRRWRGCERGNSLQQHLCAHYVVFTASVVCRQHRQLHVESAVDYGQYTWRRFVERYTHAGVTA